MPNIPKKQPHRAYLPKRERKTTETDSGKFLNSTRWRRTRRAYINQMPEEVRGMCENCYHNGRANIDAVGVQVDHIVPRNEGGSETDFRNLQLICDSCHNRKSGKEGHGGCLVAVKWTGKGAVPVRKKEIFEVLK